MDITTISTKIIEFIFPFIKKNETIKKITSDISEASNNTLLDLWEKVKPLFIQEFEENEKLKDEVKNEDILNYEMKKYLLKHKELEKELETIINKIDNVNKTQKKNSLNIGNNSNHNIVFQDIKSRDISINSTDDEK